MKRPDKTLLLKRYAAARADLHAFVNSLSEAQLTAAADAAGWTVKDHLAHLAAWQDGISALLKRKPRWEAMGLSDAVVANADDADAINATLQKTHRKWPLKTVLAYVAEADGRFLRALEKLGTADLFKPYAHYARVPADEKSSEPVYGWLEGNSWYHFNEHLPWMRQIVLDDRLRKIALYGQGCDLLDDALSETPLEMWQFKPSKKAWSVHEVLVHLADSETNSFLRVRKALAEPGEPIMGYDQDKWAVTLDYHARSTDDARALLRMVRSMTYQLIAGLPESAWSNTYFHPEPGRQVRLDEWLAVYAAHIPGHIDQIRGNVTAWRKRK